MAVAGVPGNPSVAKKKPRLKARRWLKVLTLWA